VELIGTEESLKVHIRDQSVRQLHAEQASHSGQRHHTARGLRLERVHLALINMELMD